MNTNNTNSMIQNMQGYENKIEDISTDDNILVLDEDSIRKLDPEKRFQYCEDILKHRSEKSVDESVRWDAIWLAGEITDKVKPDDVLFNKIANLFSYILKHDTNGVVKHEACFQIAARNMRDKIPDLVETALHDDTVLARHEAIEALGLMRAFEVKNIIQSLTFDSNRDVSETARFTIKRLQRLQNNGKYVPSSLL
ncbi:HEAT repeat domain-containing protein [Nitrosopumilus sp.]|uniref:HEAT repeat domain-containing protein n=1 Tax=Nitrosopumilus sp. TaxID=2024843 RepID=UPI00292EB365|nr:HEAT repeat domain-containing protein [Nitrosopumilus sp.]